jgi:hypothetical protein
MSNLDNTQLEIAKIIGYEPMTQEESQDQFEITPNFINDGKAVPFNGAICKIDGVMSLFWMPQGDNYEEEFDDLVGWYEIPCNGDIEEWTFDSVCPTPAEDEVEPDHPDSWLALLGLV